MTTQLQHRDGWRGDSRHVPDDLRRRTIDGRQYTGSGDLSLLDAETLAGMGFAEYVAPVTPPETLDAARTRRLADLDDAHNAFIARALPPRVDAEIDAELREEGGKAAKAAIVAEALRIREEAEAAIAAETDVTAVNAVAWAWFDVEMETP